MPAWYIALFRCFRVPWELFTKKGSPAACFENNKYTKIICLAAPVHEKNAKNSTKRESFKNIVAKNRISELGMGSGMFSGIYMSFCVIFSQFLYISCLYAKYFQKRKDQTPEDSFLGVAKNGIA